MINSKEIKKVLTPLIVAQRYLGQPIKRVNETLWYKSPFRSERTPSFTVSNEKGIHDFGSSEHYDIFSFIQKLYNLTFTESINFLVKDFGIDINNTYLTRQQIEHLKEEQQKEKKYREDIKKWYNITFNILCENKSKIEKIKTHMYLLESIYILDAKNSLYIELFLETRTFEDMEKLFLNERKEVEDIEYNVKRINAKL